MEFLLLMILIMLCVIVIAMPRSLSLREQSDRQFDVWLARERVLREMHDEYERATQRRAKREWLHTWIARLKHKLRWVPPTIAALMVSLIPIYFIGFLGLQYLGLI